MERERERGVTWSRKERGNLWEREKVTENEELWEGRDEVEYNLSRTVTAHGNILLLLLLVNKDKQRDIDIAC